MSLIVDSITITTKAEMFQCMQARDRVAIINDFEIIIHEISLDKFDVIYGISQFSDIKKFNFPKQCYVRNKPIHSGADIDVLDGVGLFLKILSATSKS